MFCNNRGTSSNCTHTDKSNIHSYYSMLKHKLGMKMQKGLMFFEKVNIIQTLYDLYLHIDKQELAIFSLGFINFN